MLVDLNNETADPDSDLPAHLEYAIDTDVHRLRIRICVFGFRDAEIYAGPGHIASIAPDMPEILAAFAHGYGGDEDPEPGARFQLLTRVYDEFEQIVHAHDRNTATLTPIRDNDVPPH